MWPYCSGLVGSLNCSPKPRTTYSTMSPTTGKGLKLKLIQVVDMKVGLWKDKIARRLSNTVQPDKLDAVNHKASSCYLEDGKAVPTHLSGFVYSYHESGKGLSP